MAVGGGEGDGETERGLGGLEREQRKERSSRDPDRSKELKQLFFSFGSRDRTYLSFHIIGRTQKKQKASSGIMIGEG